MSQEYVKATTYFLTPCKLNTIRTLEIAKEKASQDNIGQFIIASTLGYTIKKALHIFEGLDVNFFVVGGRKEQFPDSLYKKLIKNGHKVLFHSNYKFQYPELAWEVLRRFSEGMKVCVQMNLIISDLGLIPVGEEVIAIAGTGREDFPTGGGADTAVITETVKSQDFFKLNLPQSQTKIIGRKIKEILCKPR